MSADKRTWLITGAASGLGRELATQLARRGERLILWDRDAVRLERTVSLLGPSVVHNAVVDVVNAGETRDAADRAMDAASRITRVIHCAGVLRVGPALSMAATDYRTMMEVNFLGTVNVARALSQMLIENGKPHDRSQLVLLASVAGLRGIPTMAAYSASKHAVLGFAQALHQIANDLVCELQPVEHGGGEAFFFGISQILGVFADDQGLLRHQGLGGFKENPVF